MIVHLYTKFQNHVCEANTKYEAQNYAFTMWALWTGEMSYS